VSVARVAALVSTKDNVTELQPAPLSCLPAFSVSKRRRMYFHLSVILLCF
jgi:hypothetical protein